MPIIQTKAIPSILPLSATAIFSGDAGELRLVQNGTASEIQIDVNGDETADFLVSLDGVTEVLDGDIFGL